MAKVVHIEIISEADFAKFVRTGDGKTFQKIYEQYVGLIQFIVHKYLRNQNDVDDLVQEVFSRFYKDRSRIEKSASVKSWLATTARNLAIDLLRKKKIETVSLSDVEEPEQADCRETIAVEMSIMIVQKTLSELAATGQAEELKLYYIDGMKVADIAKKIGMSLSGVTTNLTRQRRKYGDMLRQKIQDYAEQKD